MLVNNNKTRVHIFLSGSVQGVFLRNNTRRKANELLIFGWIRNLPDGRVEAILEGKKERIREILKWLKQGPESAVVEGMDIKWEENRDEFSDFHIK